MHREQVLQAGNNFEGNMYTAVGQKNYIPSDLVVRYQAVDIVGVILSFI
jgi:hypothetical protein